jgi:hypothetical protein
MEDKEREKTKKKKDKAHHSRPESAETGTDNAMEEVEYSLPEVTAEDLRAE